MNEQNASSNNPFQNDPGVNNNINANVNVNNAGGVRNKNQRANPKQTNVNAGNVNVNANVPAVNHQLIGELNAEEFMAKLMVGVSALIKEKTDDFTEQMADHEEVVQEQIDQQNIVIEQVNVTMANINATVNDLRRQITELQGQNLHIVDARGPTLDKNRILHCTGWLLDDTGYPVKPEANNEAFSKL